MHNANSFASNYVEHLVHYFSGKYTEVTDFSTMVLCPEFVLSGGGGLNQQLFPQPPPNSFSALEGRFIPLPVPSALPMTSALFFDNSNTG